MTDSQQLGMNLPDIQPVERVDEFKFEPIKGYPMLNWRGKRPFTSTCYYPAQLKEVHGEEVNGWLNKVYWGDNLQVMSHLLKEFRGKIKLVYIDPPFDSKADYKKKIKVKSQKVTSDSTAFEEKQYTDIWNNDEYLQFMYERLILLRELLSDDGSIYVHCDWQVNAYIRLCLDEVFGSKNCLNHIIWSYKRWPSASKTWQSMHDDILLYAKNVDSKARTFNTTYESASDSYLKRFGGKTQILDPEAKTRKITVDKPTKGLPTRSVWNISIIAGVGKERVGYPTQKPKALLKRIIEASSNPGDLIFDCFMGSGTTQSVSMELGRRFIGADINLGASQVTTKRLLDVARNLSENFQQKDFLSNNLSSDNYYTGFEVYNVNHYDVFRNPTQATELIIEALEINPLSRGSLFDGEKDGRMWKVMPVNRIATKADLSPLINGFDYKAFEKRQQENPKSPVEKITLVCMGHDPDLKAALQAEVKPYEIDVEVVDILRDRQDLQFKRDSEAEVVIEKDELVIQEFYPMNLLSKLSLQQENVEDWREMVESVMVDWNYDGAVLEPKTVDIPGKNELVQGRYTVPEDAGTIRIKITDLLSESLEMEVQRG